MGLQLVEPEGRPRLRAVRGRAKADDVVGVTLSQPRPELDRLFKALADAERLRLLETMSYIHCTAGVLAARLGWTRDEVSKQLKLLERAGLVTTERVGRHVEHHRSSTLLRVASLWLCRLQASRALPPLQSVQALSEARWTALAAALRNQGRRDMFQLMCMGGPLTQGAAAEDCRLAQGLASRGLKQLIAVGLVRVRSSTLPRRYEADPSIIAGVEKRLSELIAAAATAEADHLRVREARLLRAAAGKAANGRVATSNVDPRRRGG